MEWQLNDNGMTMNDNGMTMNDNGMTMNDNGMTMNDNGMTMNDNHWASITRISRGNALTTRRIEPKAN